MEEEFDSFKSMVIKASKEAIHELQRPMTVHEIEVYIRGKSDQRWTILSERAPDVLRIILTLATPYVFTKYKARVTLRGIDRRAIFYGISGERYPDCEWKMIDSKRRKKPTDILPTEETKVQNDPETVENMPIYSKHYKPVDKETSDKCWVNLIEKIPQDNKIWKELTNARNYICEESRKGKLAPDIIDRIFMNNAELLMTDCTNDIECILSREVYIRL